MHCVTPASALLVLTVVVTSVCHGVPQDTEKTSIEDVIVALRNVEEKLADFSVECTSTERMDLYGPGGKPLEGTTGNGPDSR